MKNNIIFGTLFIFGLAILLLRGQDPVQKSLGTTSSSYNANYFSAMSTSTSFSVGTATAVQILATSTDRQYAIIGNSDATNPIYLAFNGATATSTRDLKITAGSKYEINSLNLYKGAISAVSTGGTVTVSVSAKQ